MFVLLVGYAGLFRISELLNVKVKDISISDVGMSIFVSQRKNDQFCEGHTSIIARSSKVSCLVSITETLLALLASPKDSCSPVLHRIVRTKNGAYFHKSFGISYSTIRDEFKKYIFRRLLMIQVTIVSIASNQVVLLFIAISFVIPSLRIGMPDGRIFALRSVTLCVLILSCLKLLRAWVSHLYKFFWPVEGLSLRLGSTQVSRSL